jgi:hypothetical protein
MELACVVVDAAVELACAFGGAATELACAFGGVVAEMLAATCPATSEALATLWSAISISKIIQVGAMLLFIQAFPQILPGLVKALEKLTLNL